MTYYVTYAIIIYVRTKKTFDAPYGAERKVAMKYLANAFSLNMLQEGGTLIITREHISSKEVPEEAVSVVGHDDIASVLSGILGREVVKNRVNNKVLEGDELYVAQYLGPRLPEGATSLPEGAKIEFYKITVKAV